MEWIGLYFLNYLLIVSRISTFFIISPIFSIQNVPSRFKIGFILFISFLVFGTLQFDTELQLDGDYIIAVLREMLTGLLIGFTAYLFFTAIQVAGSFIDLQMGFMMANVIDPVTGAQSPLIGNFKFFIATLLFLSFNGHHYLLMSIMDSYQWIPLSGGAIFERIHSGGITQFLVESFVTMFYIAFQMVAPLIAALFLVDVSFGILAKTAPQFNLFVIGFPMKIIVGFIILLVMVSSFVFLFQQLFEQLFTSLRQLLEIVGGIA